MKKNKFLFFLIWINIFVFVLACLFLIFQYKKKYFYQKNYDYTLHFEYPLNIYRLNDKLMTSNSSLLVNPTMKEIIEKHKDKFKYSSFENCNILLFETFNNTDQNFKKMAQNSFSYPRNMYFVGSINGIDNLASKSIFAYFMSKHKNESEKIIPESYMFSTKAGIDLFVKHHSPREIYILKKNIQRQEGIFISSSLYEIIKEKEKYKDYIICQKMLQNPLLINKHKINLRIYLLIKISPLKKIIITSQNQTNEKDMNEGNKEIKLQQKVEWFIYTNGFVYYTPKHFEPYSKDKNKIITSGYIDRKIYDENPMTLHELKNHLGHAKYEHMYNNIKKAFQLIKKEYTDMFQLYNNNIPGYKFCLFGCDIAPDNEFGINILEINKGPDISYKDERDKAVKYNLILDLFYKIGFLKNNTLHENGFIDI